MKAILDQVNDLFPYTIELRRAFHKNPELGFQEIKTAEKILAELSQWEGFSIQSGIAETGIVATLAGAEPGKTILVRFDMDALPVTEHTNAAYRSRNEGVMHACGHDGHMAIGLTAAKLLSVRRQELRGQVVFLFQPAEEGLGGALRMINEGVLETVKPDIALGMHLWNEKPLGWVSISDGPVMSASETFEIKIQGKGGHGGKPHESRDPIVASAAVITALQSLPAREVHPLDSSVISICMIHAGEAHNVIPGEVNLGGTIRTFRDRTRDLVLKRFREIVSGVAEAHLCQAEIFIEKISPAVHNDPEIAAIMRQTARELFPEAELDEHYQTMASEDMAFFLEKIPGCYSFIGSANPAKGLDAMHHQPEFNFDEEALKTGAALMVSGVLNLLQR
mgnify:CR=1 FL=1